MIITLESGELLENRNNCLNGMRLTGITIASEKY